MDACNNYSLHSRYIENKKSLAIKNKSQNTFHNQHFVKINVYKLGIQILCNNKRLLVQYKSQHRDFFWRKIGNGESFIFIDYAYGVLNVVATIFHYLFCGKTCPCARRRRTVDTCNSYSLHYRYIENKSPWL